MKEETEGHMTWNRQGQSQETAEKIASNKSGVIQSLEVKNEDNEDSERLMNRS